MKILKYTLIFLIVTFIPTVSLPQNLKNMNEIVSGKKGDLTNDDAPNAAANQNIKVLELRNYLVRQGRRDEFINLFEENFVQSQNILGGYVLG